MKQEQTQNSPNHWGKSGADIVERLQRHADQADGCAVFYHEKLAAEAADEIERLRAEKAKAEGYMDQFAAEANRLREAMLKEGAHYNKGCCELAMKHRDEAEAEVKRLKEALEAAYEYIDHATGALPIIRAAISQKEKEVTTPVVRETAAQIRLRIEAYQQGRLDALEEAARVADRTAAANSSAASELEFNYPDHRDDIQALDRCAATAADIAVAIRALKLSSSK